MNFLECSFPEVYLKISHPDTWNIEKTELPKGDNPPLLVIAFKRPEEGRPGSFMRTVGLVVNRIPPHTENAPANIKGYVDANMATLRKKYDDFSLIESLSTTLGGNIAHRAVYAHHGNKSLTVGTIKGNKIYNVSYISKSQAYSRYLDIAEQMIKSFEFLS